MCDKGVAQPNGHHLVLSAFSARLDDFFKEVNAKSVNAEWPTTGPGSPLYNFKSTCIFNFINTANLTMYKYSNSLLNS